MNHRHHHHHYHLQLPSINGASITLFPVVTNNEAPDKKFWSYAICQMCRGKRVLSKGNRVELICVLVLNAIFAWEIIVTGGLSSCILVEISSKPNSYGGLSLICVFDVSAVI